MAVLEHLTIENLRQNKRRTIVTILGVILSSALILAVVGMVTSFQKMMINYAKVNVGDYHEMYEDVPSEALKYIEENPHVESYFYSLPITPNTDIDEDAYDYYKTQQHSTYPISWYEKLDTLPDTKNAVYNIYVRFDNPKRYEENREAILEAVAKATDEHVNFRTNSELLRYESQVMGDAALATLYSLAAIVIGIIVVTSVFVIRNSFSISATERARQFGMLASVGATPRQIRHSVFFEGFVIAIIGIPIGIMIGIAAVAILVVVVNFLLAGMMEADVEFSMPFWIFPAAILLSLITIFFSCLMPAIRAARMSPIDAIRGNQDIKIKSKRLRSSKLVKNTFGIGGVIADKNLKRSRKKYRTTVVSIVLSVATFIGLYSFLQYGKDMVGLQFSDSKVDYVVAEADVDFYKELQEKFNLKDSVYYLNTSISAIQVFVMQQSAFEEFARSAGVNEKDYSHIALLNPIAMSYTENGNYVFSKDNDLADVKNGGKVTVTVEPRGAIPEKCRNIEEGETGVSWSYDTECYYNAVGRPVDVELTITRVIDTWPSGLDQRPSMPMIFVPENYYRRSELGVIVDNNYNKNSNGMYYNESTFYAENVENGSEISDYIEEQIKLGRFDEHRMFYEDTRETMAQMRRMYLLISIFLYGFIIVVTLIGVTNVFNTITTNIALRAKEFAMLKSIGMTSKEFNRMVRLESLMYSSKALIIGIPLGLGLSYAFYSSIANSVDFGWIIPWVAILISILAVGLLVGIIMRYSVRQVEKQNIIETIRSENI